AIDNADTVRSACDRCRARCAPEARCTRRTRQCPLMPAIICDGVRGRRVSGHALADNAGILRRVSSTRAVVSRLRALSLFLAACLAAPAITDAQATPEPPASLDTHHRPRIGLVLSGGGARGTAHIGVLKVLEQMRVPI